ncbi:MAG: hypothetical protein K9H48_21305 [Melioribacteraceae bacterium]|nr:hypothetical protein [Melioribacteraceae bacterium]
MIVFDKVHEEDMNFEYGIEARFGSNVKHVTNLFDHEKHIYKKAIKESGMQNDLFIDRAFQLSKNNGLVDLPSHKGLYAKKYKLLGEFWRVFESIKRNQS